MSWRRHPVVPTLGVHFLRMGQAACMASVGGLLPATARDLRFDVDLYRWPVFFFAVGYLVGAPLLRLRGGVGSRGAGLMACLCAMLAVSLWGGAQNLLMLTVAMTLFGLSGIWQEMSSNPFMAELYPATLSTALAWVHGLYCLWAFLGPQLAGVAMHAGFSWRVVPLGANVCFVIGFFLLWGWRGRGADQKPAAHPPPPQEPRTRRAAAPPAFRFPWLLAVMVVVYSGASFTLNAWAPAILHHRFTLTDARAATLIGGYYGLMGVGRLVWGVATPRLGAGFLLGLTAVASALTHFGLWWAGSENLAVWSLWATGGFIGAIIPLALVLEGERQPWFMRDVTRAVFMALGVGMLLGPPTAGWAARRFGLEVILHGSLVLNVLTAALTMWLLAGVGKKKAPFAQTGPSV